MASIRTNKQGVSIDWDKVSLALIRERVTSGEIPRAPRTPDGTLMDSSGLAHLMDASQVEPIRERVSHERSVGAVSPGTSIKVPLTYGSWG